MADDGKRTEVVCVKVTERMAIDLLHEAAKEDMKVSSYLYWHLRRKLYGDITAGIAPPQSTTSDKVYLDGDEP